MRDDIGKIILQGDLAEGRRERGGDRCGDAFPLRQIAVGDLKNVRTGAGGKSSAVPWPEGQRQLDGATEVKGPGAGPKHPQRVEKAGQ